MYVGCSVAYFAAFIVNLAFASTKWTIVVSAVNPFHCIPFFFGRTPHISAFYIFACLACSVSNIGSVTPKNSTSRQVSADTRAPDA